MSDEQIRQHFQVIRQQIAALRGENTAGWQEVDAALEDLQVIYEQMQTNLATIDLAEEELVQQQQYYQDLFQFFPIASLVTNADGVILEANQAIAQLLNVSHSYLIHQPLAGFVADYDRFNFLTFLNQLPQTSGIQLWQTSLCPRESDPILAELHLAIARNTDGEIERLRIGVYNMSPSQQTIARSSIPAQQALESRSQLPQSLDGLQVLFVDDEADIRDFVTTALEVHGIQVRAVSSAAAALEEIDRFRPDVLLSDIRMPDEDGYSLIRRIRAREADRGGHLPAAAITAYLEEDREKAIEAGYEAHLHKLVQPSQWVEMVARLAAKTSNSDPLD